MGVNIYKCVINLVSFLNCWVELNVWVDYFILIRCVKVFGFVGCVEGYKLLVEVFIGK